MDRSTRLARGGSAASPWRWLLLVPVVIVCYMVVMLMGEEQTGGVPYGSTGAKAPTSTEPPGTSPGRMHVVFAASYEDERRFFLPVHAEVWKHFGVSSLVLLFGDQDQWQTDEASRLVVAELQTKPFVRTVFVPVDFAKTQGISDKDSYSKTIQELGVLYAAFIPGLEPNDWLMTTDFMSWPLNNRVIRRTPVVSAKARKRGKKMVIYHHNCCGRFVAPDHIRDVAPHSNLIWRLPLSHLSMSVATWREVMLGMKPSHSPNLFRARLGQTIPCHLSGHDAEPTSNLCTANLAKLVTKELKRFAPESTLKSTGRYSKLTTFPVDLVSMRIEDHPAYPKHTVFVQYGSTVDRKTFGSHSKVRHLDINTKRYMDVRLSVHIRYRWEGMKLLMERLGMRKAALHWFEVYTQKYLDTLPNE